jgi:hypothetical protein
MAVTRRGEAVADQGWPVGRESLTGSGYDRRLRHYKYLSRIMIHCTALETL